MELEFNCCSCHGFQSIMNEFSIFFKLCNVFVCNIFQQFWVNLTNLTSAGLRRSWRWNRWNRQSFRSGHCCDWWPWRPPKKNSAGRWQMCQRWLFTIPNGALVGNTVKSTRCISKCVFGWPDSFLLWVWHESLRWLQEKQMGKDGRKIQNIGETAPFSSYMFFCSNSKLVFSLVDASEHQG